MWFDESTSSSKTPKVCNYFVENWIYQGHTVVVVPCPSAFPSIYYKLASLFPAIAKRICGDNCGISRIEPEGMYDYKGAVVYSTPLFKYIPHNSFSKKMLDKASSSLLEKLNTIEFKPDAIIGHFCNPTIDIINRLAPKFPNAKTAVVLHEGSNTIRRIFKGESSKALNSLDSIGFRSVSIKDNITSQFKLTNYQFMCYSGIPSSFIERGYIEKKWTDAPVKSFLYVGRMAMYKHPQSIPEALSKVYNKDNFTLRYIGSKDAAYKPTVDYCVQNNISDKVEFLGQIDRDEIIKWYDASECFVMISDHEVFGLVYLEAMARGCITIAGDNGGMVDIIEHGVNGFLCNPGDANALAAIIRQINSMSSSERNAMSRKARETALKYSDEKVAQYYIENVLEQENRLS